MPLLSIRTNVRLEAGEREKTLAEASRAVADMLGKPESYVMVYLEDDASLSFAGSREPAAWLELKSLGLPESETARFSQALCALAQERLGVAPSRTYIEFSSPARHMWGWDGRTF